MTQVILKLGGFYLHFANVAMLLGQIKPWQIELPKAIELKKNLGSPSTPV